MHQAADSCHLHPTSEYIAHRPQDSVLYQVLQDHLEQFLADRQRENQPIATFVERELRAFLDCGILANGFLRTKCEGCQFERAVAFSCKRRGFCPSCGGKRMAEVAEHLIEHVLPVAPYRQYVLTLPFPLRFWSATSRRLLGKVYSVFASSVASFLEERARRELGVKEPKAGSVTFVQHFGSALQLTPHFHLIAFDGVFETQGCLEHSLTPKFHELKAPSDEEIAELLLRVVKKIIAYLRKSGYLAELGDEVIQENMDPRLQDETSLLRCMHASIVGRIAFGEAAGQKVTKIGSGFGYEEEIPLAKGPRCFSSNGFSLHANVKTLAHHRDQLERLIRYTARPPLSNERLSMTDDGQVELKLKRMFSDGTLSLRMSPTTFISRLCAIIPQPHAHLIRYQGILSSAHKLRNRIILRPGIARGGGLSLSESKPSLRLVKDSSWARLLARCFKVDVSRCPRCGGDLRIIGAVTDSRQAERYLRHLGLAHHPPPIKPAKFRQGELHFEI